MYYSGIDLHKDMCFITTINCDGSIVKQSKLPNSEFAILNYFFSLGKDHHVVVESTSNWYQLSDLLNNHQISITLDWVADAPTGVKSGVVPLIDLVYLPE